jgi:hypothetical protein
MLKLLTAPVWVLPWGVSKVYRARAIVRQGRRSVRVHRSAPVVVRVTVHAAVPPRPDAA